MSDNENRFEECVNNIFRNGKVEMVDIAKSAWNFQEHHYTALLEAERKKVKEMEKALNEVISWNKDCYCLSDEETGITGGKTCPACIARETLTSQDQEKKI